MAYGQQDRELLLKLLKMQERTAPISISIGYVTTENQVREGIIIHEAPPAVVNELVSDGYSLSLTAAGMFVSKL